MSMSLAADCEALLRRAQQNVAHASAEWTSIDSSGIADCVSALDSAASDLQAVMNSISQDASVGYSEMRADLLALKRTLAVLNRLVDASAAFVRNLPGQSGGAGKTYEAGGHLSAYSVSPSASVEA